MTLTATVRSRLVLGGLILLVLLAVCFSYLAVTSDAFSFSENLRWTEEQWKTCNGEHDESLRDTLSRNLSKEVREANFTLDDVRQLFNSSSAVHVPEQIGTPTFFIMDAEESKAELICLLKKYHAAAHRPYCTLEHAGSKFPSIGVQKNCAELWFMLTLYDHPWRRYNQSDASMTIVPLWVSLRRYLKVRRKQPKSEYLQSIAAQLTNSAAYQRFSGRDHIITCPTFFCGHELASQNIELYNMAHNFLMLGYCAQFMRMETSCFSRAITIPYPPQFLFTSEPVTPPPFHKRDFLLSFAGKFSRKGDGGTVRSALSSIQYDVDLLKMNVHLREIPKGYSQVPHDNIYYRETLYDSKFCLVPRGDTPQTQHLFSTIVAGCIPVVVSDEIDLPMKWIVDYDSFFIRWKENDFVRNPKQMILALGDMPPEEAEARFENMVRIASFLHYGFGYASDVHSVHPVIHAPPTISDRDRGSSMYHGEESDSKSKTIRNDDHEGVGVVDRQITSIESAHLASLILLEARYRRNWNIAAVAA